MTFGCFDAATLAPSKRWTKNRRWTREEDDILARNFRTLTYVEIGKLVGRSESSVQNRMVVLDLRLGRLWTDDDNDYLEAHWLDDPAGTAQHLGRTELACKRQMSKLKQRRELAGDPPGEIEDAGSKLYTLPPTGPGYGPRIVHRIACS